MALKVWPRIASRHVTRNLRENRDPSVRPSDCHCDILKCTYEYLMQRTEREQTSSREWQRVAATNYPHSSDRLTNQRDGNRDAKKNCYYVESQAKDGRDSIAGYGRFGNDGERFYCRV